MTRNKRNWLFAAVILLLVAQGCNLPVSTKGPEINSPAGTEDPSEPIATVIQHQDVPVSAPNVEPYPDVTSVDTAPEKRAPYGDSYDINRLERPFTQDMTYISDLDISGFGISEDNDWYFVSIGLVGNNPNNPMNIQYSIELDTDLDSFGDLLLVASPPYSESWTANNVRVYADTNHDSAGLSPVTSDAPFAGDGYDRTVSDPLAEIGDDFDIAWIRINAGPFAVVQFAFKKSLSGDSFLYSVMADAGLRSVSQLDYVDYITEEEAGSSVRRSQNYPLKQLFAVDNTCYQAFGFVASGIEPKICPVIVQPSADSPEQPQPGGPSGCQPPPGGCPLNGPWEGEPVCLCGPG